ncbi:hypothetical protein MACH17_28590 [Phaeobacter inhibens]|uniref:hypothetical protein n=1 Tax=Phaeobacter inhibens TaxID=221822 RepID=UPI00277765C4|nr:hypothetical protein [Phaeobacter inhibens]GLO71342.1 hypothetical protein MACH17_28590 [Phaeobacter inhibens]
MTTSVALVAEDGSSLTEAYTALRLGYPEIFEDLKGMMKGEKNPEAFGGSGDPDFTRLQIDLKHLPPEGIDELRPIFTLLRKIIQTYSEAKIAGEIIITEGEDEIKYHF